MPGGPQPRTHDQRLDTAQAIANRVLELHGEHVQAIGLYGSTGRGTDGPCSDIEMFCVLDNCEKKYAHEWVHGPWKAEVDFFSPEALLNEALHIDERWPLTHGSYSHIHALYDPLDFFSHLRALVRAQPAERFIPAMRDIIIFELYEEMGKLRNARSSGNTAYFPLLAVHLVRNGAFLIGLAHRYCYSTDAQVLAESLTLPDRPDGYDALCHMVMQGHLSDPQQIFDCGETFWSGVESWAEDKQINFIEQRIIPF
jgi:kanamycin nucleotidyltransferase